MKRHEKNILTAASGERPHGSDRGVALITTLVLLALLSAASLAMVLLVSSDTLINGYYGNYRGSFYAADSGINVVVASLMNSIQTTGNIAVSPPLPMGSVPTAVNASYAAYQNAYYVVGDANSWNGQFKLVANQDGLPVVSNPVVTSAQNIRDRLNPADVVWTFSYPFEVTVEGQSTGKEDETVTERGTIIYSSLSGSAASGGPPSFAKWGGFIDNFASCQGPLVPGTMTGPFFTDGQWNFGNDSNPGYTFTDTVGQQSAQVSWWNGGCTNSASAPPGFSKPTFNNGLQLNQGAVTPPSDNYNQAQAVMDGKGLPPCTVAPCAADPPPSQTQMNQVLQTVSKTAYPSSGSAPTGVYFPVTTSGTSSTGAACSSSAPCFGSSTSGGTAYGGGFYVQGNAGVTLTATTGGDGTSNPTQTYTIAQSSGGTPTTTTIVVDVAAGTTSVSSTTGSGRRAVTTSETLSGVPTQVDPNTGEVQSETEPQSRGRELL